MELKVAVIDGSHPEAAIPCVSGDQIAIEPGDLLQGIVNLTDFIAIDNGPWGIPSSGHINTPDDDTTGKRLLVLWFKTS